MCVHALFSSALCLVAYTQLTHNDHKRDKKRTDVNISTDGNTATQKQEQTRIYINKMSLTVQ
jgi:hypothetical protein